LYILEFPTAIYTFFANCLQPLLS